MTLSSWFLGFKQFAYGRRAVPLRSRSSSTIASSRSAPGRSSCSRITLPSPSRRRIRRATASRLRCRSVSSERMLQPTQRLPVRFTARATIGFVTP
ncbi:MAG: hypothetical protein V8Q45_08830 [Alistipes onderdonkii]